MTKKIITVFLTVVMAFALSVSAFAETAMPLDMGSSIKRSTLSITGTTVTCNSYFKNSDDTITSCVVKQSLEKHAYLWVWDTVGGEWQTSSNGSSISFTNTKSGLSSGKYQVKSVFCLTSNTGEYKEYTVYSEQVTIP